MRSIPGATVKTLQNKLKKFNLEKCETIISADQGNELDNFSDNYSSLLNDLTAEKPQIIVSDMLPREV